MADEEIARVLEANKERLTESWMAAVRRDGRIDSDAGLSRLQLRDHVPAILEELSELLRSGEMPDHANTLEGRVKVFLRIQQGYRGRDLVRETTLLRIIILDDLVEKCREFSEGDALSRFHRAARIVNLYMDEVLRTAISAYSELPPDQLPVQG